MIAIKYNEDDILCTGAIKIAFIGNISCDLQMMLTEEESRTIDAIRQKSDKQAWGAYSESLPNYEINQISTSWAKERVLKYLDAVLPTRTVSSVVGAAWSQTVNHHGTVSGQDKVHPKTGLLTFGQIFAFYTNKDSNVNFGHFTTLKDLATNCSMSIGGGVRNFHTKAPAEDVSRLAALEARVQQQAAQLSQQAWQIGELHAMMKAMMQRK